jgi:hypothetical protein
MSVTTQVYILGNRKQLIDLNGDITNFSSTFKATSKGGEVFEALVVDQNTLDGGDPLQYRKVDGDISGTVKSDNGVYQNYYLVLRADTECECEVEITKTEIPMNKPEPPPKDVAPPLNPVRPGRRPLENFNIPNHVKVSKEEWGWKPYLIILVLIVGGMIAWYFYKKQLALNNITTASVSIVETSIPSGYESPSPPITSPSVFLAGNKKGLLDRLNNVKF